MEIISVTDRSFSAYGQVLEGYDLTGIIDALKKHSPMPKSGTLYVASDPAIEALSAAAELQNRGFGGLPVQIGYCNGFNSRLTCLEYHRTSEIDIACDDIILLLAREPELEDRRLSTDRVRAFLVPAGTAVELFATTLHYAPCGAAKDAGFHMGCVLPRGTNLAKPAGIRDTGEERLLAGANKWVIASEGTDEAKNGAFVGIYGAAIDLFPD